MSYLIGAKFPFARLPLTIEEPPMTVDLFLITLLETEQNLNRHNPLLAPTEFQVGVDAQLCGVLVDVCRDGLAVDDILTNSFLVYSHCSQDG